MSATLEPDAELAFIAISPFREDARHLNAAAPHNLKIRIAGSEVAESEYVTTASTTSVNTADAKKAIEHRSPTQLAMEIEATLDEIIGDSNGDIIIPEYTTGVFIARVEELLAAGADISNSSGSNLLTKAVLYFKSPELISLLLEGGANPNRGIGSFSVTFGGSRESIPGSPLNYAVFFEDVASIELLLDAGAIVDNIVLQLAGVRGRLRIIELLLADGTNSIIDADGLRKAATTARQHGNYATAQMLEAAAAKLN